MLSKSTNLPKSGFTRAALSGFLALTYTLAPLVFGDDNSIEIDTKGSNSSIYIKQIGSSNTARVWCGLSNGTFSTHTCSNATFDIDQDGTGNLAKAYSQYTNHQENQYTIVQDGNDNIGYIDADEDDNELLITQTGDDMEAEIYMSGDDNVYTISQSGTGEHYAKFYAFGDDSTWTATQSGSGDHNAYIKSCNNCNNNDASITQSGSGNKDGDIEFKNNPSDNSTVNLTQSGDGAHTGDITVEQGNYILNATQTGVSAKSYVVTLDCTSNCNKTITVNQYD
tara:strand:+ start:498 stop:1340 length:843 start_codon:yes stop_codon:yes gene_type:complete